ncbi:caspase family protein [Fulvivirga lutimaris]|uniref:caspase family protein n=1 Tax=Fulvivirga lutimaris TaxID=1819566 RepID=UPI0012BB599C|nr:caspase family protein [Fulvivirga lutimaris]MTI41214.1 caspase family protein [Fulvivirga lutimaris]
MILRVVFCLLLLMASYPSLGQLKLPSPISSTANSLAIAMLPDSSLLLSKTINDKYQIVRYVFKNQVWTLESNKLSDLLNGIVYEGSHLHFRFSNDYTKLIVMLHGKGDQRIYLSELKNNNWSLFRDIIDPADYSYFNFTPSMSFDNEKLFLSDNSKPENTIYTYNNTDSFSGLKKDVLKEFKYIQDVIGVGVNSVLVNAQRVKGNPYGWFFIKQLETGGWSVPYKVNELDGAIYKFALSVTPFDELMLFIDFEKGDVYLTPTPPIVRQELTASKKANQKISSSDAISRTADDNQLVEKGIIKPTGNYYALLIGNSDYEDNTLDLDQPDKDIKALKKVLTTQYSFEEKNVVLLESADRETIFKTMYKYRTQLTSNDNLLIFYAGHGYWDERVQQGYWWPTDARPNNPSNWLSNSDLKEQIKALNTAHTLLISDACFSGGIFKTRGSTNDIRSASADIQLLYRMPSRRAMTSGTKTTVPDNSVFFKYLIKYLLENEDKYLSSSNLFNKVRKSVLNNSLTVPQEGVIMDTGDEGGDFIFIKKD